MFLLLIVRPDINRYGLSESSSNYVLGPMINTWDMLWSREDAHHPRWFLEVENRENLRIRHLSFGRMIMEKSLRGCWLLGAYCVTPGFLKRKPSLGSLSCIPLPPTMSKRTRRGII